MYDERVKQILGFNPETGEYIDNCTDVIEDRAGLRVVNPFTDVVRLAYDLGDFLGYVKHREQTTKNRLKENEEVTCVAYPEKLLSVEVENGFIISRVYHTQLPTGFKTQSVAKFIKTDSGYKPFFVTRVVDHGRPK